MNRASTVGKNMNYMWKYDVPRKLCRGTHVAIKVALYRIWCGVNRLGDCGVEVVGIDSAILQPLLSWLVIYC